MVTDWQELAVLPEGNAWAGFPPDEFVDFCRRYPRTPFDGIPPAPHHLKAPSFLHSQAHRIWLTTSLIHERMVNIKAKHLLDLGSFPFFAPLVIRDYFGFDGQITVTTNVQLEGESRRFLDSKGIQIELLDLDPYVHDPTSDDAALPRSLPFDDETFDVVTSSHVIEHLYHPRSMLQECQRVLRKDGEAIITTDNAMMVDVFANYIGGYGYTFEPVEHTAAMHFDFWRGHVRFFTERDLRTLVEGSGMAFHSASYFQCFYDILLEEYFSNPVAKLAEWKLRMLRETPWLRNDIAVIARKRAS